MKKRWKRGEPLCAITASNRIEIMPETKVRIAITDDSQHVALTSVDWSSLKAKADISVFHDAFDSDADAAQQLKDFDIIVPMRERTVFSASLLGKLPKLRLIALTGGRAPTLDMAACTKQGILVCNTGAQHSTAATAELAFGLILACARRIPQADHLMKNGGWHDDLDMGFSLGGKTLGIVGLGRLGSRVASYGRAFGMNVIAWSQNLTPEAAESGGATRVEKDALFQQADVVSIHMVLSDRSRGLVGASELDLMKKNAILINTSRGPIVESKALIKTLKSRKIWAAVDVFDEEPLPANAAIRKAPNLVITPHLGYSTSSVFAQFYGESVENIHAFLDQKPIRMLNPEAINV
jgi:phosphoglycerate dehydrogenase-like enzyme